MDWAYMDGFSCPMVKMRKTFEELLLECNVKQIIYLYILNSNTSSSRAFSMVTVSICNP